METTEEWMARIFEGETTYKCCLKDVNNITSELAKKPSYLLVPIKGDRIEVPVFAINDYIKFAAKYGLDNLPDYMALRLESQAAKSEYISFDKIIKSVLDEDFRSLRLIRFEGKDGDRITEYYGTNAALFDKAFNPLMLCTWEFEKRKIAENDGVYKYCYYLTRPVLRIEPHFYTKKYDNTGRFICKKMVNTLLSLNRVFVPYIALGQSFIDYSHNMPYVPKVVIDEMPFKVCKPGNPSITTTNQELKKIVLDNIEDSKWQ